MNLTWHDRSSFILGALYVDDHSDVTVEYVGAVTAQYAREIVDHSDFLSDRVGDAEPVLIFRPVDESTGRGVGGGYAYTRVDADTGQGFKSLADRVAFEAEMDEDP